MSVASAAFQWSETHRLILQALRATEWKTVREISQSLPEHRRGLSVSSIQQHLKHAIDNYVVERRFASPGYRRMQEYRLLQRSQA